MDSLVTLCLIFKCLAPSPNVSMPALSTVKSQLSSGQQNIVTLLLPEVVEEDQSSRLNATLHRALKAVKDFGENIRSYEIFNNHTKINM